MAAMLPDWWGEITPVDVGLNTDRYVASVEIREVNDVLDTEDSRETVGGRFVFHHMIWSTVALGEDGRPTGGSFWPVHEVGRNPDVFDPEGAPLLHANSKVMSDSVHPALQRQRHQVAPRNWLALPPGGLRAEVPVGASSAGERGRYRHSGESEGPAATRLLRAP